MVHVVFCGLLRSGPVIRIGLYHWEPTFARIFQPLVARKRCDEPWGGFRPGLHLGYLCGKTLGVEQNAQLHLGWVSHKFSDFNVAEAGWNSAINIKTAQRQATGPWPPLTPPLPKKRCESQGGEQWDQSQALLQPQDSFAEKQNPKLTSAKRRCRRPTAPSTGSVLHKHLKSVNCANAFVNYGPKLLPISAPKILQTKTSRNRRLKIQEVVLKYWICGLEHQRFRSGQVRSGPCANGEPVWWRRRKKRE